MGLLHTRWDIPPLQRYSDPHWNASSHLTKANPDSPSKIKEKEVLPVGREGAAQAIHSTGFHPANRGSISLGDKISLASTYTARLYFFGLCYG
jgi:hypothetical protein